MILNPSVSALDSVKTWGPYLYSAVSDAFPTLCVYCGRARLHPGYATVMHTIPPQYWCG